MASPSPTEIQSRLPAGYSFAAADSIKPKELARLWPLARTGKPMTTQDVRNSIRNDQASGNTVDTVGIRDTNGTLVGTGSLAYTRGSGVMRDLAVSEEHQHNGLGRTLVEKRLALADELGLVAVYTLLSETNTLPSFYAAHGFQVDNSGLNEGLTGRQWLVRRQQPAETVDIAK